MSIHSGGTIFWYQYCQTGCVSAIAQATSITRIKTACLPDQRNMLGTSQTLEVRHAHCAKLYVQLGDAHTIRPTWRCAQCAKGKMTTIKQLNNDLITMEKQGLIRAGY